MVALEGGALCCEGATPVWCGLRVTGWMWMGGWGTGDQRVWSLHIQIIKAEAALVPETPTPNPQNSNPQPEIPNSKPKTQARNPKSQIQNPTPQTQARNPKPHTQARYPKPQNRNPKPEIHNLKTETLDPKTRTADEIGARRHEEQGQEVPHNRQEDEGSVQG